MSKLICLLKNNAELYANLNRIIEATQNIMSIRKPFCQTDHGIEHSKRVIDYMNDICDNIFLIYGQLNEYELFILLSSVYLHDIGFFVNKKELGKFCEWKEEEYFFNNESEFCRNMHSEISSYWIYCNLNRMLMPQVYYGDSELGYCIMKIINSHSINFWEYENYKHNTKVAGKSVRELYLCFLLCLADALDCDKRRNLFINNLNEYKIEERIFIRKHEYINKVEIKNNQIIFFVCEPNITSNFEETFFRFYEQQIIEWIEILLEEAKKIFSNSSTIFEISIQRHKSTEILEPTVAEYELIRRRWI